MSKVKQALTEIYNRLKQGGKRELSLNDKEARFVIFSDLHKGASNRADDFRQNHPVYNAAVTSYYERGYSLIILGDAEELWQESPDRIFNAYRRTFELEGKFHKENRYNRAWGNHDIDWEEPDRFRNTIKNQFNTDHFADLTTSEGTLFTVKHNGKEQGELFLTHGHQGTLKSDILIPIARRIVLWI